MIRNFEMPTDAHERASIARRTFSPTMILLAILALLAGAPRAAAHAQLVGTSPLSGATVRVQPAQVIFKFGEHVGGTLGAVRVYDAQGVEVDDSDITHPDGNQRWMGVGLRAHLPDGTYTATYRVISADTHIVYGGLVFNIGHPGTTPKFTVAGLISKGQSGEATKVAFGVVRGLNYLTLALMLGGLAFLCICWLSGLAAVAGADDRWHAARHAFDARMARVLAFTVALGVLVSVLGLLLQGASAAGISLWDSLKGPVIEGTLKSRFGVVWGLRSIDWLVIGLALALVRRRTRMDAERRPDRIGADRDRHVTLLFVLLLACCAYLAITPALAGHASIESPVVVFFPSDVLHVLAGSVWVGGIACLLGVLPCATRPLEGAERSRLLLGGSE